MKTFLKMLMMISAMSILLITSNTIMATDSDDLKCSSCEREKQLKAAAQVAGPAVTSVYEAGKSKLLKDNVPNTSASQTITVTFMAIVFTVVSGVIIIKRIAEEK